MGPLLQFHELSRGRAAALRLYLHSRPEARGVFWRINGFRAKLLVWTAEEWEKMDARPPDAQFHPSGVWCALRLD
jgi:hypothetical protein